MRGLIPPLFYNFCALISEPLFKCFAVEIDSPHPPYDSYLTCIILNSGAGVLW